LVAPRNDKQPTSARSDEFPSRRLCLIFVAPNRFFESSTQAVKAGVELL